MSYSYTKVVWRLIFVFPRNQCFELAQVVKLANQEISLDGSAMQAISSFRWWDSSDLSSCGQFNNVSVDGYNIEAAEAGANLIETTGLPVIA